MGGLAKKEVFLYDTDGKYLRKFESVSFFAREFQISENIFSIDRRKVLDVFEFEDGRIAATYRIGREGIKKYRRYKNSVYVGQGKKTAETVLKKNGKLGLIKVYNLDNEIIAEFKNSFFAKKLLGITSNKELPKLFTEEGLRFELIKEE